MALKPINDIHKKQIEAGVTGRRKGHKFEELLSDAINALTCKHFSPQLNTAHVFIGNPAVNLLRYISSNLNVEIIDAHALWLGGLATSGCGDKFLDEKGNPITKCKSDVLIKMTTNKGIKTIGVSVKTCNKITPTNDQIFFTTARAFCQLLRANSINVSGIAEQGLLMFCGDLGYRPIDIMSDVQLRQRISDPSRFYWEEIPEQSQQEWHDIFSVYQDEITKLLFQKAYKDDPYQPDFLLHQTVRYEDFYNCETAIFSMDEIVGLSREYSDFILSKYVIRKGKNKNDNNIHLAPRFGFIQFQRGGQKQHPTQLQFNLKAGYFRYI